MPSLKFVIPSLVLLFSFSFSSSYGAENSSSIEGEEAAPGKVVNPDSEQEINQEKDISVLLTQEEEQLSLNISNFPVPRQSGDDTPKRNWLTFAGACLGTCVGATLLTPIGFTVGSIVVAGSFGVVGGVLGKTIENGGQIKAATCKVASGIDGTVTYIKMKIPIPPEAGDHIKSFVTQSIVSILKNDYGVEEPGPLLEVAELISSAVEKVFKKKDEHLAEQAI